MLLGNDLNLLEFFKLNFNNSLNFIIDLLLLFVLLLKNHLS